VNARALAAVALGAAAAALAAEPDLRPSPPASLHAGADGRCERCHSTESWQDVTFAHEKTGFPLRGQHRRVGCQGCHREDTSRSLGRECGACHRDPHRGTLGPRCGACHAEESWVSRFDAEAHRRAGFPLSGRHAFLPCEECHGDRLDRGQSRPISTCYDCHQADYLGTSRPGALDHAAAGFPRECRQCHQAWTFQNGFYPGHDGCFVISSGPHAGIRCRDCHATFPLAGQCGPACTTTRCTNCHTNCSGGGNLRLGPSLPGRRLERPLAPAFPGRRP